MPWLRAGRGRSAAAAFFEVVGAFRFEDFQVLGMMAGEHQVVAEVRVDAVLPNGARLRDEELHPWNLDDAGRITRFRHVADTAKHIAAARGG